jgi:hypothetical protein
MGGTASLRTFLKFWHPRLMASALSFAAPVLRAVSQQPSAAERFPSFSSQSSLQDRLLQLRKLTSGQALLMNNLYPEKTQGPSTCPAEPGTSQDDDLKTVHCPS